MHDLLKAGRLIKNRDQILELSVKGLEEKV
jgi:hypothetical protein